MEVKVQWVRDVGARTGKGTHLPDHGHDDGERGVGRVEGDVNKRGGIDEAMNGSQGVAS